MVKSILDLNVLVNAMQIPLLKHTLLYRVLRSQHVAFSFYSFCSGTCGRGEHRCELEYPIINSVHRITCLDRKLVGLTLVHQ